MGTVDTQDTDGFSRRVKLRLIELVGLALLVAGAVHIVLGSWAQGVPVLVLGALVLLHPTQIVGLVERFLPKE